MARPTLLIGFGSFGRDALQRLLHQSALRGVLRWKETRTGGVASAQRQLKDLAMLALPDPYERPAEGAARASAGAPQFLTDLYRQIAELPPEDGLAERVRAAADDLLAQTAFDRRDPVGLDLIVLAHPSAPETVPHLDILLQSVLETLADSSFFRVAVQGAENLNCILVLDFEDYWSGTGTPEAVTAARDLRSALRNSMQVWERRRAQGQVAVDRCYLVDGRTAAGYRPPPVRLDEVVLFLELLLFEGLRAEKQELYQQKSLVQPIAASFGVRLLEESAMALCRESAARFGRRWLDALIGDGVQCPDREARRLRETLAPCRRQAMDERIDDDRLTRLFDEGAERMVESLMAVPDRESPDWHERVQQVYARERQTLAQALERAGWEIVGAIKEAHLKDLDWRVTEAVEGDLHDDRAPASLALVRAEIGAASEDLRLALEDLRPPREQPADPLVRLKQLHRRYLDERGQWLERQGRALQWFWPLFALLLGLGLAPLTVEAVDPLIPLLKPGQGALVDGLRTALARIDHPLFWTFAWTALIWSLAALLIQPRIAARIRRAQRFFASGERGRFHDAIRASTDPLRAALLLRVRRNIRSSLGSDVQKTLSRVADRLAERGREMDWLRRQLNEYLKLSGQPDMAVRKGVRREGLLSEMTTEEAIRGRICYPLPDLPRPFEGWDERFCDAFLDPLRFVDTLSLRFLAAYEHAQERRDAREDLPALRQELIDFIDNSGLELACRFLKDEGVTDEQVWCVAAQRWRGIPGLAVELDNRLQIVADDIVPAADRSRVYLLMLQTGVAATQLERSGS